MCEGAIGSDFERVCSDNNSSEIDKDNDTVLYLLKERKNIPPLQLQLTLSGGSD